MKTLSAAIVSLVISLSAVLDLRAQDPATEESTREAKPVLNKNKVAGDNAAPEAERLKQVRAQQDLLVTSALDAAPGPAYSVLTRPGGAGAPLVIRSSEIGPKEQADLQTDLAIMVHILEKTVDELPGARAHAHSAMGIDVYFAPGPAPMRSLYLESYGALFFLNVEFPLLAPATKDQEQKATSEVDPTWERARQELYGQSPDYAEAPPAEPFSEEKVTRLKDSLLSALKNAANIHTLKPGESITLCVFGAPSARGRHLARMGGGGVGYAAGTRRLWTAEPYSPASGVSILTIRVKKADVDAFAKGNLAADEFRKRAQMTTYATAGVDRTAGGLGGFGGGLSPNRF